MHRLLRILWGWVGKRRPFQSLSPDLLLSIFVLLPGRDLVAASLVCKDWLALIRSNDSLWLNLLISKAGPSWPLVLFAEKSLRSLPPFRTSEGGLTSFQQVSSARQQLPYSVIIDGGSGYCKYGWSKFDRPTGTFPTFSATMFRNQDYGNIETPSYSSLMHFFSTIYESLAAKPTRQPVVISTPICHYVGRMGSICHYDETEVAVAARRNLRHVTHKVLFDMGVKAVCAVDQAVLALVAAKQTSGIVVNIGFQLTSVVPIRHGKIMRNVGVEVVDEGALQLTARLWELMQQSGIPFDNIMVANALKEKLCYVAQDYAAELCKNTEETCSLKGEGEFKLNHERFMACEIMFQPYLGRMSLQQAVALCIEHCLQFSDDDDNGWYNTVVLCGGSACLPGLAERLKKELCKMLPHRVSQNITVVSPANGAESAWCGANLLSNVSCFVDNWCITKEEFEKHGQKVLDARECFYA